MFVELAGGSIKEASFKEGSDQSCCEAEEEG